MGDLVKSEESEKMPHLVAFHQNEHCLLRQKLSSEKKVQ